MKLAGAMSVELEDVVNLVVYSGKGYLLVETVSKNLRLPSSTLYKNEDFHAAATRLLDEVRLIGSYIADACLQVLLVS